MPHTGFSVFLSHSPLEWKKSNVQLEEAPSPSPSAASGGLSEDGGAGGRSQFLLRNPPDGTETGLWSPRPSGMALATSSPES
jgi:hypothetical protein